MALASDSFVRVEVFLGCCCWLFPVLICSTPSCDVVQQRRRRPNKQNGKRPRPQLQEPVSEQNGRKAFIVLLCSLFFLNLFSFLLSDGREKNPQHFLLLRRHTQTIPKNPNALGRFIGERIYMDANGRCTQLLRGALCFSISVCWPCVWTMGSRSRGPDKDGRLPSFFFPFLIFLFF